MQAQKAPRAFLVMAKHLYLWHCTDMFAHQCIPHASKSFAPSASMHMAIAVRKKLAQMKLADTHLAQDTLTAVWGKQPPLWRAKCFQSTLSNEIRIANGL